MDSFERVELELVSNLIPILESRLPKSANVLNMVLICSKFPTEMEFYTLKQDAPEECWILGKHDREDAGQQFAISPPKELKESDLAVIEAFKTTKAIDWDKHFEFIAVDRSISHIISNISAYTAGNITEIVPCLYYYLEPEEARKIVATAITEEIELKTLNSEAGFEFLREVWPVLNDNTQNFRIKNAKRLPSMGVFINGRGVSGCMVNPTGHMGVGTHSDYRRKGFAGIGFQHLTKLLGDETPLYPCAMVYIKNKDSHGLQTRAGLKVSHLCDFIFYRAA